MPRFGLRASPALTPALAPSLNEQDLGTISKIKPARQHPNTTRAPTHLRSDTKAATAIIDTPNALSADRHHSHSCDVGSYDLSSDATINLRSTGTAIELSVPRDSSDGSSVSDKASFRASVAEPPYTESAEDPPQPTVSALFPSSAPPPFSSLYFSPQNPPDHLKATVLEPDNGPPPAFAPVAPTEAAVVGPTRVEAETKAALPADNKGVSSKSAEDEEAPPPYTEGSSPLDSFTYVMAAAGGASSIITQVQQGGPAPVNTLSGMRLEMGMATRKLLNTTIADVGADEHITLDLRYGFFVVCAVPGLS